MKINLDGLYDLLGSADARRQFEDLIIQRLREKLDWLKLRVDRYNACEKLRSPGKNKINYLSRVITNLD